MTAIGTGGLLGAAAEAALAVPGVVGLQPRLAHRLAAVTAPTWTDTAPRGTPPEAGVRADRAPDGRGWDIEVRCVLAEGPRAVDIARNVHDRVVAAVVARLCALGVPESVTVTVTVTRLAARPDTA